MQEELEPWEIGRGILRAVEGAKDWFLGEVTGVFKDEVPAAELLSYLDETAYIQTALILEHAVWEHAPTTARHGVFTLEWQRPRASTRGLAIFGALGAFDFAAAPANRRHIC